MAARIIDQEYVPLMPVGDMTVHPRNPRRGNVGLIEDSIVTNGFYGTVMVQRSTGHVIYGNHRLMAARIAGLEHLPALVVDVDDTEAARILIGDNATSDAATYDERELADVLASLAASDLGLAGTGWNDTEYEQLLASLAADDADPYQRPSTGSVLAATDVGLGEPTHQVTHGEVYRLGPWDADLNGAPAVNGPHYLVIAAVMTEHALWLPYLTPERIFCPYPGLYVTLTVRAFKSELVLVQPDPYLAGHLLDKHESRFTEASIVKVGVDL